MVATVYYCTEGRGEVLVVVAMAWEADFLVTHDTHLASGRDLP